MLVNNVTDGVYLMDKESVFEHFSIDKAFQVVREKFQFGNEAFGNDLTTEQQIGAYKSASNEVSDAVSDAMDKKRENEQMLETERMKLDKVKTEKQHVSNELNGKNETKNNLNTEINNSKLAISELESKQELATETEKQLNEKRVKDAESEIIAQDCRRKDNIIIFIKKNFL